MQKRKFKYLYQLICTSIILVIVLTLLFYNVVWKKSFCEVNHLNVEYYTNVLNTFTGTFANEISQFNQFVSSFSVNSRSSINNAGVFYDGTDKMKENMYYSWEAARDLESYSCNMGYEGAGIYYYEDDILLVNGLKFTRQRYISEELGGSKEKDSEWLDKFFSMEAYKQSAVLFAPVYDSDGHYKKLLVGVCTMLGKNKEKALMIYLFDEEDFEFFQVSAQGRKWEKYYVLDGKTKEMLYYIGAEKSEGQINQELQQVLGKWKGEKFQIESTEWYIQYHDRLDLLFMIDVSGDIIQNNVVQFYNEMQHYFIYILSVMLFLCSYLVYVNYKPMHNLLRQISHKEINEFDSILSVWENQNDIISEQRMMITDLLMNHLLYGVPISQKYIEKLGVSGKITKYCVFVIRKYVLKVDEVEMITKKVEADFNSLLFITDLTVEHATVIIAFMRDDRASDIYSWLAKWCNMHLKEEYPFQMGSIVDKIEDIRHSFLCCMDHDYKDKGVKSTPNETLKIEILDYINANYTDSSLSQSKVSDHFEISIYTLSNIFNNQIGMGFPKYINSKRIEHAKELLLTTDLSVKRIANSVGILDHNYFSRIFKSYEGVSPIEYRKKRIENNE